LLANGLDTYWNELQSSDILCNNLAKANVIALRKLPVLQVWLWLEKNSEGTNQTLSEMFGKFNWSA